MIERRMLKAGDLAFGLLPGAVTTKVRKRRPPRSTLFVGGLGVVASWLHGFMIFLGVDFGWILRPAWQNWLVLALHGLTPVILSMAAMSRAHDGEPFLGISAVWLPIVPFALIGSSLAIGHLGLWPL